MSNRRDNRFAGNRRGLRSARPVRPERRTGRTYILPNKYGPQPIVYPRRQIGGRGRRRGRGGRDDRRDRRDNRRERGD